MSSVCVCVYMCACACVRVHVSMSTCACMRVCSYVCACVYLCRIQVIDMSRWGMGGASLAALSCGSNGLRSGDISDVVCVCVCARLCMPFCTAVFFPWSPPSPPTMPILRDEAAVAA